MQQMDKLNTFWYVVTEYNAGKYKGHMKKYHHLI